MSSLQVIRFAVWSAVLVVGTAAGTIYLMRQAPSGSPTATSGTVTSAGSESALGKAPYELTDVRGRPFDREALRGAHTALFFGFTHCPDICPTTLGEIASWYGALGDEAGDLRTYFVSIDPERDTPEVLAKYLSWNEHVTGVTGTPEETARMAKSWGVFYEKVPDESGGYTMDHTSAVYLLDRAGELQTIISYEADSTEALQKLRQLLAS